MKTPVALTYSPAPSRDREGAELRHVVKTAALLALLALIPAAPAQQDRPATVIKTETRVVHHFARGRIHRIAESARPCRRQSRALSLMHNIENLLHLLGGFAENEGAADVGFVMLHRAPAIDQ